MKNKKRTAAAIVLCLAAGVCYLVLTSFFETKERVRIVFGTADQEFGEIEAESTGGTENSAAGEERVPTEAVLQSIWVHVCGEVMAPDVYELAAGSRVVDAIRAAGGLTPEGAGEWLNQAMSVEDGQRIYVPSKAEAEAYSGMQGYMGGFVQPGGSGQYMDQSVTAPAEDKINLNTADKERLMTLPGIGSARAEAIIESRQRDGPFRSVEDIRRISGINGSVYEKLKDRITVE